MGKAKSYPSLFQNSPDLSKTPLSQKGIWNENCTLKFFTPSTETVPKDLPVQRNSNSPLTAEDSRTGAEGKLPLYWGRKFESACLGISFLIPFFFLKLTSDKKIKMINAQERPYHPSRQSPFKKGSLGNPTDLYYVRIKIAEWQFWTLSISDSLTLSHLLLVAHSSELHFNFSQ